MPEMEDDIQKRPAARAFMAFAIGVLLLAIAYRGMQWLSNVEEEAPPSPIAEQDQVASAEWEASAKLFEVEKSQAAAILAAGEKVEAFRIQPLLKPQMRLEDYPIVSRADNLNRDFATRLASLLLDPKSYVVPGRGVKTCLFQPRVAFRVWKGSKFADVLICFDCQQLMVVESDPEVPERFLGDKSARFRVGGDFDPVVAEITRLAREAFPGDRSLEEILSPFAVKR